MKAIFPALCGALLLATSLPAAAAPAAKSSEFALGAQRGSSSQVERAFNVRQLPERSISAVHCQSTYGSTAAGKLPKAESTLIVPRSSRSTVDRTSTIQSMGWKNGAEVPGVR